MSEWMNEWNANHNHIVYCMCTRRLLKIDMISVTMLFTRHSNEKAAFSLFFRSTSFFCWRICWSLKLKKTRRQQVSTYRINWRQKFYKIIMFIKCNIGPDTIETEIQFLIEIPSCFFLSRFSFSDKSLTFVCLVVRFFYCIRRW